ncbi:HipA domain-containing protein [Enterococcus lactis]|uniref:HipA domain-containing protein n=1 Tax=Enterococcus lactis TaxID=357441 RepID=UPI003D968271
MNIIDVSNWIESAINPTGNREKIWLRNPNSEEYLFKKPKIDGEIIGEVASFHIGTAIFGLSIPETYFAKKNAELGTISKSFISNEEKKYLEFQEIVDYYGENFDAYDLNQYSLHKALSIVTKLNLKLDFYKMCIFDYVIANQDRHVQNWGIIMNRENQQKKFSPLYDNGSSLFSGYTDEQLEGLSTDRKRFEAFTNRAKSLFFYEKKKPKFINILQFLYKEDNLNFNTAFSNFKAVNEDEVYDILIKLGVSELRSCLISDLIVYRVSIIKKMIQGLEVE